MEFGLLGQHLPHSFSKEIHEALGLYTYELQEVEPDQIDTFMTERNFKGINVTIPYKQDVISYLETMSEGAQSIGAVNTIVNTNGKLHGYNTDFGGMKALINHMGLKLAGSTVAILGTGGTSKTARAVASSLGAASIFIVSRSGRDGALTYEQLIAEHTDVDFIINTTPCGMYPHADEQAVDLAAFVQLKGVIDAIYNPLNTRLVLQARELGIPAEGGLYMLVAQAVLAAEIFTGRSFEPDCIGKIYAKLLASKRNIALIGMPSCGKSTVGKRLASKLGFEFIDTDSLIEELAGCSIPHIFETQGEAFFRDLETKAIAQASAQGGRVIATGGGAVLRPENITLLRSNSIILFLDRPLSHLVPTDDRPLAQSREQIEALYQQRIPLYRKAADRIIKVRAYPNQTAKYLKEQIDKGVL